MPRRSTFDEAELERLLNGQYLVITRRQALACGMSPNAIDRKIAPGGPWRRLLPGVYVAATGTVMLDQREIGALLYAGPNGLITGPAAVRRHHLSSPGPDGVDVLIPWELKRQSVGFVRVHRTRRLPEQCYRTGPIQFAKPARAVADAARLLVKFDDVRAVICEAVQRRACTVAELTEELNAGPSVGTAFFREALAEVGDGVRSVAEADFRHLLLRSDLPNPMFNAQLFGTDGKFIAMVDAWWQRAGVAAEVDSRAYHMSAADQDTTAERRRKLIRHGIFPLHFAPKRIRTHGTDVLTDIAAAIEQGLARPPLPIRAIPLGAG
ncbi:MAG TPA: hypothetical protein VF070_48215 [Streptosporangiaceae bacterium]